MKRHTKQIASGVILFVLGRVIIPTVFFVTAFTYTFNKKPLAKFTIPHSDIGRIEKRGRYYLWNDYYTVFDGQTYACSEDFPGGLDITLHEKVDGRPVDFVPDLSIASSGGGSHKRSIGYFKVEEPGIYFLSVLGETEPRVCSFETSIFTLKNIFIFLSTFVLTMLTGISGFILIIIGIIDAIKAKKLKIQPNSGDIS